MWCRAMMMRVRVSGMFPGLRDVIGKLTRDVLHEMPEFVIQDQLMNDVIHPALIC